MVLTLILFFTVIQPVIAQSRFFIIPSSEALIGDSALVAEAPIGNTARRQTLVTITAYSSTPDQTDDTPFITASGTHVRDGVVAANFLPFGTKLRIPELFGDKVFEVEDRMNRRYAKRLDIWFPERQLSDNFGVREARIVILSYGQIVSR